MLLACTDSAESIIPENEDDIPIASLEYEKYEPEDGKCYVFIGQDMGAIGGLEDYNQGYCDYFQIPAGITVYSSIPQLGGIYEKANWGSGDCYADLQANHPTFSNSAVALGLSLVNACEQISKGEHDNAIRNLGNWIKSISPKPVFLRIGYEFDGFDWNHYEKESYKKAFIYIHSFLSGMRLNNVAYVWQSKGYGMSVNEFEAWYPGDNYVDWCAYSYFSNPDEEMIKFARKHKKPVFIAEATPTMEENGQYVDSDLSKPEVAQKAWENWFLDFFNTIEKNDDVVKAFSYINVDWSIQNMWINNPTFQQVDSRIQESDYIKSRWINKLQEDRYINASDSAVYIMNYINNQNE